MNKILIADDENKIRNIIVNIFDNCHVTGVGSWFESIKLLEEGEKFDLIITDIIMPGYKEIAQYDIVDAIRKYEAPVIFISGYDEKALKNLPENMKFVKKPFSMRLIKAYGERLMASSQSQT